MASHSKLLDKESTAFATERDKSTPKPNYANLRPTAANKAQPMDELLEDTLLNVTLKDPLTKRETEILKLIVAGKTNKKIATEIYRTERTVEYHRHRLMRKLDANTAADLIRRAITFGLI